MTIGICDYGIGGISLYKRLRELSDVDTIYYSDAGYVPYGKVPEAELRIQVQKVIGFLFAGGADYVAVACNAASTVLPDDPNTGGMIAHGLRAVRDTGATSVGIVGGYRTVLSEVYKKPLEAEGRLVKQQVAQALSIRIEAGDLASEELMTDIETIFAPLAGCENILLACTHYPVISDTILRVVPGMKLLDPMEHMVRHIQGVCGDLTGTKQERWVTSGDPEIMRQAAAKAFDVRLTTIEQLVV
jgi:glutamate racemase